MQQATKHFAMVTTAAEKNLVAETVKMLQVCLHTVMV
jgi:hypothetical protein